MGIYKRKQESKKHAFDQVSNQEKKKRKHAPDQESDQEKRKTFFLTFLFSYRYILTSVSEQTG